jgi:hypothetical protein
MAYTLSPTQSEFSEDLWHARNRPADRRSKQQSLGKRASRCFARFLIIFCVGVAATLAWQSYGDAAREMIANSSPQLGWLALQAAPVAQTTPPDMVAPIPSATPSPDLQQIKAMLLGLAAVRQSVEQLAAGQEQMTGEIAKLQAAEQEILDKISAPPPRPAAAPARKPAPLPSSQAPPVR